MVSSKTPVPLYSRIFDDLKKGILEGRFPEGGFLPSEFELSKSYGVSRITAKRALDELAASNLAVREQGRGTLVHNGVRKRSVEGNLKQLVAGLRSAEISHRIRLVSSSQKKASPDLAAQFDGEPNMPVCCIKRVLVGAVGPTSYVTSYLNLAAAKDWPKSVLERKPITTLIEEAGVVIIRASETVSAVGASADVAAHLGVKRNTPLLKVVRRIFDRSQCIEIVEALHRSDRYEYRVSLGR